MIDNTYMDLIKSLINTQKDLVAIFEGDELVLTNDAFNSFFGVSSTNEYSENFSSLLDHFVPHPSYFNKSKIAEGDSWFDSIMMIDEIDRIVSMLNQSYEPQAFAVNIDMSAENFKVVTLVNITQSLVKRIMIENNASLDRQSGAYAKKYFLQVMHSYEEAAVFNEKIIGLSSIAIISEDTLDEEIQQEFVAKIKSSIRQDDMLIRWNANSFFLIYLVDNEEKGTQVAIKLKDLLKKITIGDLTYNFSSVLQKEKEKISALIKRLNA